MASETDLAHFVNEYTFTRLSEFVFKIVQADHCGEFPFFYAILGQDKIILLDTGVGPPSGGLGGASAAQIASRSTRSLKDILDEQLNPTGLPYKILATHVHYDHIGNVHAFADADGKVDVAMGDSDPEYAEAITSHACGAARGAAVKPFQVAQWLSPGEEVFLDDGQQCEWNAVRAIPCPGHTPDGTAYYFPRERRLFVADTVYPFTAISLLCAGSSVAEYSGSIHSLLQLVQQEEEGGLPEMPGGVHTVLTSPLDSNIPASSNVLPADTSDGPVPEEGAATEGSGATTPSDLATETEAAPSSAPAQSMEEQAALALAQLEAHEADAVSELCGVWLGVEGGLAGAWKQLKFDPVALLRVNEWNVEGAMGMWGEMGSAGLKSMLPAPSRQSGRAAAAVAAAGSAPDNVVATALALPAPSTPVGMVPVESEAAASSGESIPVAQVTLACGHVEAALPAKAALGAIFRLLVSIAAGDTKPQKVMHVGSGRSSTASDAIEAAAALAIGEEQGGGSTAETPAWPFPEGAAEYSTDDGQFVLHLPFPTLF